MANLFAKAKAAGTTKQKVEKNLIVELPRFSKKLELLEDIETKMAELAATKALLNEEILEASKDEMLKLYESKSSFPGTIKIVAGERSFQFITNDKYSKIDKERYEELVETYGGEVVEEKTKFVFNAAILEKYQDIISELIEKSKKITEEDKEKMIESEISYNIKKGTISSIGELAKESKLSIRKMVEDIRPIYSIKMTGK